MVNVAGNQSAKITGIFASTAASALVREEFNAIHIFEKLMTARCASFLKVVPLDFFRFSGGIQARQRRHLLAINGRRGKSQFLFERLLQDINVAVLTENQRNNQPVISRADLSIRAVV